MIGSYKYFSNLGSSPVRTIGMFCSDPEDVFFQGKILNRKAFAKQSEVRSETERSYAISEAI